MVDCNRQVYCLIDKGCSFSVCRATKSVHFIDSYPFLYITSMILLVFVHFHCFKIELFKRTPVIQWDQFKHNKTQNIPFFVFFFKNHIYLYTLPLFYFSWQWDPLSYEQIPHFHDLTKQTNFTQLFLLKGLCGIKL